MINIQIPVCGLSNWNSMESLHMEIVKINQQNLTDINKANQPFEIIGKIKPVFSVS